MRLRVGLLAAITVVSGVFGCGGDERKLVPVSGTVTLNGKPLRDAVISFLPDDSNKGALPAEDITGPEGNYKAMTRGRSGLSAGKYKVVITKSTVETSKVPAAFKDDPYMARLSTEGPQPTGDQGAGRNAKSTEIKGEFDREVEPAGSTLDFDVKAEVSKS
jgi:hypothetical protein